MDSTDTIPLQTDQPPSESPDDADWPSSIPTEDSSDWNDMVLLSPSTMVIPGESSIGISSRTSLLLIETPSRGSLDSVRTSLFQEISTDEGSTSVHTFSTEAGHISDESGGTSAGMDVLESQGLSPLSSSYTSALEISTPTSSSSSVGVQFENSASSSKMSFALLFLSLVALAV